MEPRSEARPVLLLKLTLSQNPRASQGKAMSSGVENAPLSYHPGTILPTCAYSAHRTTPGLESFRSQTMILPKSSPQEAREEKQGAPGKSQRLQ